MAVEPTTQEMLQPVQRAFSKQAEHYDVDDFSNQVLIDWRKKVYGHLNLFLKPGDKVLELNAGTGIDALYLAQAGHAVHATDISPGMIQKIQEKIDQSGMKDKLTTQQCSFESLDSIKGNQFDYVFSNFGGLNCCKDLTAVTRSLPNLLKKGAYLTWVIMPPVCLWEWIQILKGRQTAFRRLKKQGTIAHLESEHFITYYYSVSDIIKCLGPRFQKVMAQGLGSLSPPPASLPFTLRNPSLYSFMKKLDGLVCGHFPFNRWADHIIVTFQFS